MGTEGALGGLSPSCLLQKPHGQGTSKTPLPEPLLTGSPALDAGARTPDLLSWEDGQTTCRPPGRVHQKSECFPVVEPDSPAHCWRGNKQVTLWGSPHQGQTRGVSRLCVREGPLAGPLPRLSVLPLKGSHEQPVG